LAGFVLGGFRMYKVIFIDDEPWVIRAIHKTFQWKQAGFEVIAALTSSVEALEVIFREKPDVVFTDIRMPSISGIDLMRKVREAGLDTEFVVVSGFSEFSYAQQALQLGAFDYCLKPLQPENTKALLDKLYTHLENKKNSRSSDLFETLMEDKENIEERIKTLGMKCKNPYYQALILQTDKKEFNKNEFNMWQEFDYLEIQLGENKLFYFLNTDRDIKELLATNNYFDASIGISQLSEFPNNIDKLYIEADMAVSSYFIYNEYKIFSYCKKNIVTINEYLERILPLIDKDHLEELKESILDIPQMFRGNGLFIDDLTYLWNQIVAFVTKKFALHSENTSFDFMDYSQILSTFYDINTFSENLLNDLLYLLNNLKNNDENNETLNLNFNKLLKHVQEHFHMQLLLKDLSKQYFINHNYCSILFKKYTGCTFTDYINRLRMEKSKMLLESVDFGIGEIAQKVGYNDYFYYIKVFKKYYGTTPSKYRKKRYVTI
jgi:two-component system, response regulator YesN